MSNSQAASARITRGRPSVLLAPGGATIRAARYIDIAVDLPTEMTHTRIAFTALSLLICFAVASPAPAGLLYFTSSISQQESTVLGEVRAGPQQGLRGIPADDIRAARLDSSYVIMAGDVLLVTVDEITADLADSRPQELAQQWAENLRRVFVSPYLCIDQPPNTVVPLGESRRIRYGGTYAGQLSASSEDQSPSTPTGRC